MKYLEINWLLAFLSIIITILFFFNFKIGKLFFNFLLAYKEFIISYFEKKEDSAKLKKIILNLKKTLKQGFKFFCLILVIICPIIFLYIYGNYYDLEINDYFLSLEVLIFSIFCFILIGKLSEKTYNPYDRLIHNTILNNRFILNFTYDIEKKFFIKKNKPVSDKLFICGYARAGTTAILNNLYSTGYFISLLYSNLPFALSPKINDYFRKLSLLKKNSVEKKLERAHKDGIFIDQNSPEAFEEIFWKYKLNNNYIKDHIIEANKIEEKTLIDFEEYISHINKKDKIYLSKNNNNILRIQSLVKIKNSNIFIILREPLSHCLSLLNQHINFIKLQNEDKFILEYMNSLGHYEFGLNQKSFFSKNSTQDKLSLYYWLYEWKKNYENVLLTVNSSKSESIYFITYEGLCENKHLFIKKINDLYELNINETEINFINKNKTQKEHTFPENEFKLINECKELYNKIKDQSLI